MKLRTRAPPSERLLTQTIAEQPAADAPVALMTTLRYDRDLAHLTRRVPIALEDSDEDSFFLSKLHLQKLQLGARLLGWPLRVSHSAMVAAMNAAVQDADGARRVRVTLSKSGELAAIAVPTPPRDDLFRGLSSHARAPSVDPVYEVFVDTTPRAPRVATMLKTPDRSVYDQVRAAFGVQPADAKEVLVTGLDGCIVEGTLSNVAVMRGDEWVTPDLANGGMAGVLRGFLLELKFVREGQIRACDLVHGETVLLFNGMQGVCAGVLNLTGGAAAQATDAAPSHSTPPA